MNKSMIIKTVDNKYINLNNVLEFSFRQRKTDKLVTLEFILADDETRRVQRVQIKPGDWHAFEYKTEPLQLMPAEPGYFELRYWANEEEGGEEGGVDRWPVIAWQLHLDTGIHRGMTLMSSSFNEFNRYSAILCPDGRVIFFDSPGSATWKDEKSWLADMKEQANKAKQVVSLTVVSDGD